MQVAAELGFFLEDVDFSRQAYQDAIRLFGKTDPVTQVATRSLAHALGDENLAGIYHPERLREAEELSRKLVVQVEALPASQRRPVHYQYMNQLAVMLNGGHKYAEAARVVQHAIARGGTDGQLRIPPAPHSGSAWSRHFTARAS